MGQFVVLHFVFLLLGFAMMYFAKLYEPRRPPNVFTVHKATDHHPRPYVPPPEIDREDEEPKDVD